jgi:tetratricopeptide (TPR) repeat protein
MNAMRGERMMPILQGDSGRGRRRRLGVLSAGAMLGMPLVLAAACGGGAPPAKNPESAAADTSTASATPTPAPKAAAPAATTAAPQAPQEAAAAPAPAPVVMDDVPSETRSYYDKAFQAWNSGDLAGARTAFNDAANHAPRAGAPRYSLGCVLERLGDTQGALDAYRGAFAANSKYELAIGAYAVLLAATGHGPDAEQFLADRQGQAPDSVALITYQAEVKSIEGDSPGSQQLAQQALTKQPDFTPAMIAIARDFYRNHRWDLAKYALGAILDGADDGSIPPRDKGNPQAILLRALIERDTSMRKQAIADFEQASVKRPDLFEAYINLGEMKLEAGNATEAQPALEAAVRYAPNFALAHLDLGDCYRLLGRTPDAKREYETAGSLDPTLAGVHYNLGLLYLFSPSVPGAADRGDQLAKAIQELESYRSMRGAKTIKGQQGDDVDELLSTAKRKQNELQQQAAAAAAAAAAPAASSAPADSAAAGAAAPAAPVGSSAPAK